MDNVVKLMKPGERCTHCGRTENGVEYIPCARRDGITPSSGYMKWNWASGEFEYWLNGEKALVFSDLALMRLANRCRLGHDTGHVEVITQTHSGHPVIRSVPLKKLEAFVKGEWPEKKS